jgi:hypothetical protein
VNAPPVVCEHVEHAQDEDEEGGGPFGFEPDGDHAACGQSDDRHKHSPDAPLPLDHESQKEEDEQDATGKEEAGDQKKTALETIHLASVTFILLFLSVVLANGWQSGERSSSSDH